MALRAGTAVVSPIMPFQKGQPKFGGRKAGVKNRKTREREVVQAETRETEEAVRKEAMIRMEIARLAPREEIDAAIAAMGTLTPLEVLLAGMQLKLRRGDVDGAVTVAEKAAPY